MKYLVFGGNGWLGKQIVALLKKEKKNDVIVSDIRVDNEFELIQELNEYSSTDRVVCVIGRTRGEGTNNIDYLEGRDKMSINIRDNLYSPILLALHCKDRNIHMTYIGTGCIFNDTEKKRHFTESEDPNYFGSSYSIVKGYTDRLMRSKILCGDVLNIRIRMPVTDIPEKNNFITKLVSYDHIIDIPNSVTVLPNLLPYLLQLIEMAYKGTINFVNPGAISHGRVMQLYKQFVNHSYLWKHFSLEEQDKILLSGRCNTVLSTTKLTTLFPDMLTAEQAIIECMKRYREKVCFNPKVILITGGLGFIGSHVLEYLFHKYPTYTFINYDCMTYAANSKNISNTIKNSDRYAFVKGDVLNFDMFKQTLLKYNVDTVMHFAAESHVDISFKQTLLFTKTNINGSHNVFEACLECKDQIKRLIHVSTDEVYGGTDIKMGENNCIIQSPTNPYAASKAAAECIAQSYINSFKLPIIITRGNNVYGERQLIEKVIPKFITRIEKQLPLQIHGDGSAKRSFIHVKDVNRAFDIILHYGSDFQVYNIGTNNEVTIKGLANIIKNQMNKSVPNEFTVDRKFNDHRYFIDTTKLMSLGWRTKISFHEGLQETIQWYKNNPNYWEKETITKAISV